MIRINLIKTVTPAKSETTPFPWKKIAVPFAIVAVIGIIGAGGLLFGKRILTIVQKKARVPSTMVAAHSPESQVDSGKASLSYEPSSHTNPTMQEDVVQDAQEPSPSLPASETFELGYDEMSRGEKINYEVYFVNKVLEVLTQTVPEGVGFSSLSIDSFQTVSGIGVAPSREAVSSLFASLNREKFRLLEPPRSIIRSSGAQGYRFVFTCKVTFGSHLSDGVLITDHLVPRSQLKQTIRTLSRYASRDGVALRYGLSLIASDLDGGYRRITYRMNAVGSYKNFVKFVLHLNKERIPCAFKTIRLKAINQSSVDISADLIVTVRN